MLGHACEEGRHALGLKKLAIKLGGPGFDSYQPEVLLCGEEAETYFQDLDRFCDEAFADRGDEERVKLAYCYVTWLVERRALDVYGMYKNALGESEIAKKLGGLLAEETKHLADVEASLRAADPEFSIRSKQFEVGGRNTLPKFYRHSQPRTRARWIERGKACPIGLTRRNPPICVRPQFQS